MYKYVILRIVKYGRYASSKYVQQWAQLARLDESRPDKPFLFFLKYYFLILFNLLLPFYMIILTLTREEIWIYYRVLGGEFDSILHVESYCKTSYFQNILGRLLEMYYLRLYYFLCTSNFFQRKCQWGRSKIDPTSLVLKKKIYIFMKILI